MSEAMFDKSSWSRALGPTLRVVGYFAAGFVAFFLIYYLLYFIAAFASMQSIIQMLFGILGPIILFFLFVLSIFKVLDEELSGR